MSIFDGNKYKVNRLKKTAMKIEGLKEEYSKLSNEQLVAKTQEFKDRIKKEFATLKSKITRI